MNSEKRQYVFGPVPSRRLGRSLGIDLVPFKTCSYNCIYCQLGKTTCKTTTRKEWVSLDHVQEDLQRKLNSNPDYITLSGSGEPTLYARNHELIDRIRLMTDIPIAVLTNGSLLWKQEVRDQLLNADLVIPSLDAGDEAMFQIVNRPHPHITHEKMLQGLIDFQQEFRGQFWLEIFLLGGHTAIESELIKLKQCVEKIQPDRLQLNTVTRPPAEYFADGVPLIRLKQIADFFNPSAEVIADYRKIHQQVEFEASREEILNMLQRRPCSLEDIVNGLGVNRNEILKHIEELIKEQMIIHSFLNGKIYYKIQNQTMFTSHAC